MRRRMNNKLWLGSLGVLLVICIVLGIMTRLSHSYSLSNPDILGEMHYSYWPFTSADVDFDIDAFLEEAPIIIEGVFDGNRIYMNRCFLSDFRVTRVIKGDEKLQDQIVKIYETVMATEVSIEEYRSLLDQQEFDEFMNWFGYRGNKKLFRLDPIEMYIHGMVMMKESEMYILFLDEKDYPVIQNRDNKPVEFVLKDNPFAKLSVNDPELVNRAAPLLISQKNSLKYEVLTSSTEVAIMYSSIKNTIIEKINNQLETAS